MACLVGGDLGLLLEHQQPETWLSAHQLGADSKTDDAASDDGDVELGVRAGKQAFWSHAASQPPSTGSI